MITPIVAEQVWLDALNDKPRWIPPDRPTIVLAPHPDDEILAPGGLIAHQRRRGNSVTIIAVTDGERAYPEAYGLGHIRAVEQARALAALGVQDTIIRLRLPDSHVASHEADLTSQLAPYIRPGALLVAPWQFDFHPDHEACGRAANHAAAESTATLVSYLFWAWHRSVDTSLTRERVVRFDLDEDVRAAKNTALACHRSQLEREDGLPVLPELLLAPAKRDFETFILHE